MESQRNKAPMVRAELDEAALAVSKLSEDVLGENFVTMEVTKQVLTEHFEQETAHVEVHLAQKIGCFEQNILVAGAGVGLVDAFFDGMMKQFGAEYRSLANVSLIDFQVGIKTQCAQGRKTDADAIATIRVANSEGYQYAFAHRTPSISRSSISVVRDAVLFFVNSERAYTQLHVALKDAQTRGRPDLVERFRSQMSTLVQATSYQELASQLKST